MKLLGFGRTDVGKKRNHNEDTILLAPDLGLYMVCDGMGGHAGGEVASAAAVAAVRRHVTEHRALLQSYDDSAAARDQLLRMVDDAIQRASSEVYQLATSDRGRAGMGTTLTLLLFVKNIGVMGHVGDTRLYMLRGGQLHQLSEDHTYVNEMLRRGMGTAEELRKGPYANVITRAVGIQANVRVDTLLLDVLPGDAYLICSDGLTKHVEYDHELAQVLRTEHVENMPADLVELANGRGGTDNISAVVVRADAEPGDSAQDLNRSTQVSLKIDTLHDIGLFRHLDMGELCKVLNVVRTVTVERGEVVVREGEPGDSFFTIVTGNFMVKRGGTLVTNLRAGAHFGEMALFNNRPRTATIEAVERSTILVMDRASANDLVTKEPALGVKLLWSFAQVLATRLDETSVQLYGATTQRRSTDPSLPLATPEPVELDDPSGPHRL